MKDGDPEQWSEFIDDERNISARDLGGYDFDVNGGRPGNWERTVNIHPLTANKIYRVNGFYYHTDAIGRVTKVEAELTTLVPRVDQNYTTLKKLKDGIANDQGGHLIGAQFGGAAEYINIVPQRDKLNLVDWKRMEETWANTIRNNGKVKVTIEVKYADNVSARPSEFKVDFQINNQNKRSLEFDN